MPLGQRAGQGFFAERLRLGQSHRFRRTWSADEHGGRAPRGERVVAARSGQLEDNHVHCRPASRPDHRALRLANGPINGELPCLGPASTGPDPAGRIVIMDNLSSHKVGTSAIERSAQPRSTCRPTAPIRSREQVFAKRKWSARNRDDRSGGPRPRRILSEWSAQWYLGSARQQTTSIPRHSCLRPVHKLRRVSNRLRSGVPGHMAPALSDQSLNKPQKPGIDCADSGPPAKPVRHRSESKRGFPRVAKSDSSYELGLQRRPAMDDSTLFARSS